MGIKKPRFNWIRQRPHKAIAWLQGHEKTASWLGAVFTGLIFLVTAIYATVAFFQMRAMNATVQQTQTLIGQQKESLVYAKTQADAAKTSADAALIQAKTAQEQTSTLKDSLTETQKLVRQNERGIKATETQAKASMSQAGTSRIAADAARDSAQFARQSYEVGQVAKVFFKTNTWRERPTAASGRVRANFEESNAGATAYGVSMETNSVIVSPVFQGMLPCVHTSVDKGTGAPMESGADETLTITVEYRMTEQEETAMNSNALLFLVYGQVWWTDSLGRKYGFSFCRAYNKDFFPQMVVCAETIKVPTCTKH